MALTEDDVERLAGVTLRILGLRGRSAVQASRLDGSAFRQVWFYLDTLAGGFEIFADSSCAEAVVQMLDGLTNDLSETSAHWGEAFPRCPGHRHPADYAVNGSDIILTCPSTGHGISRTSLSP